MQRISWPQHNMSKKKWPGVVSNDLWIATVSGFGVMCVFFCRPQKATVGAHRFGTWGFGAFQSKRNCLRDRSGNPNKNMVLVEIWVAVSWIFFCWLKTSEICVLLQMGLVLEIYRCWKKAWETLRWHDMSDEGGCDCDLHYLFFQISFKTRFHLQQMCLCSAHVPYLSLWNYVVFLNYITLPETNSSPVKTDLWNRRFLLETTIFRGICHFSLGSCTLKTCYHGRFPSFSFRFFGSPRCFYCRKRKPCSWPMTALAV